MGTVSSSPGVASALMGVSRPPLLAAQAALGSTGSAVIEGNNICGKITFVVGGVNVAAGKILVMTFQDPLPFANKPSITFEGGNPGFSSAKGMLYAECSKTQIDLYVNGVALGAGTYIGYYHIIGY